MPTRSLNVIISGDARPLEAASKQASRSLDQVGGAHQKAAKATDEHIRASGRLRTSFGNLYARGGEAILAVAGLEGIKKGVESVIDAYKTQEVANSALKAQMKALNQSYSAHKGAIDEVVKRTSHLSGISVPELTSTFTVLDRATGNVHKSLGLVGTAADVAAAKHISASRAAVLLGKVADGNVTAFNRYGLSIKAGTSATDALHQIQKRFAGQAKAYGDTAAGAGDKLKSSWEEVRATLGSKVAPAIASVERGVAGFITGMQDGTGAGGAFAKAISTAFNAVKSTVQTVVKAVRGYLAQHRQDIQSVISALAKFGQGVEWAFEKIALPIIKRTVAAIGPIIGGLVEMIRGVVRLISGLLSGNWSKAWSGAKEAVGGAVKVIETLVTNLAGDLWDIIKNLGPKLIKALLSGLVNLGKALTTGIVDGVKAAAKAVPGLIGGALKGLGGSIIDGMTGGLGGKVAGAIGKVFGSGDGAGAGSLPSVGTFSGSLDGANAFMAPFAALGTGMGLHLTAGRTNHSEYTSSGNVSYHYLGDAIDEAGPFPAMHRYAQTLFSTMGGRLRELISPWPQLNIKDGHSYRYPASIEAEHSGSNAHVHVAYMPSGDGPGVPTDRQREVGWLNTQWAKIAPLYGLSASTPLRSLFNGISLGFGPFVGEAVDPGDTRHLTDSLFWPDWVWKDTDFNGVKQKALPKRVQLKLFLHEMAHRFQDPKQTNSVWKAEGGAESFARLNMQRYFGGWSSADDHGDPYNGFVARVRKQLGIPWITRGQFGRFFGTNSMAKGPKGDGIGFRGLESLWVQAGGSPKLAPLMAHVAQAESGGRPGARNPSGASGLWQILGQPFPGNVFDPLTNARMAVWKYQHQGLGAWAASRPAWGRYVGDGEVYNPGGGSSGGSGASPVHVAGGGTQLTVAGHGSSGGLTHPHDFGPVSPNPDTAVGAFALGQSAQRGRTGPVKGNRIHKGRTAGDEFILQQAADVAAAAAQAQEDAAAAAKALTDALTSVQAEIKRSNDIASGLQATDNFQLKKYLADVLGGFVVGRGVAGRSFTPGVGTEFAY